MTAPARAADPLDHRWVSGPVLGTRAGWAHPVGSRIRKVVVPAAPSRRITSPPASRGGLTCQPETEAPCHARVAAAHPGVEHVWGEVGRDRRSGVGDVHDQPRANTRLEAYVDLDRPTLGRVADGVSNTGSATSRSRWQLR